MAYTDFGFGTGLSYKYDFNARHQRRRQNRADVLSEKRYEDQIAHRDEREALKDERYTEELQHTRDTEAAEYAYDQSQLYNPPEYATRYSSKRTKYTQPLLEQIGDIENSPNFSSDPEKMKTLQNLRREVQNMPGEEGFKSAVQDYDQMVQDYKKSDIDAEEYRKQISEWQSYNKSEGVYGEEGGTHYSYIPEEKFSMPSAIDAFIGKRDIVSKSSFAGKDGDYTIRSLSDDKLDILNEEFYNNNKERINKTFEGFPQNLKNEYGTGEEAAKAFSRHSIETALKLGSERIRDYASVRNGERKDNTNYYLNVFGTKETSGTNPYVSDVIPITKDGMLESNQLRFFTEGKGGIHSPVTNLPVNVPAFADVNISGGTENITEWIKGEDGQLFGKTKVWMSKKHYDATFNNVQFNELEMVKTLSNTKKKRTGDILTYTEKINKETAYDAYEDEEIVEFETFVPFDTKGISEFNKHSSAHKPYGEKKNTELKVPENEDPIPGSGNPPPYNPPKD